MHKISLKVNVLAFIFGYVGRIHLQIILRNKNLIFKIFIFKTPSFTEDHVVATKMVWLKGFKRLQLPKLAAIAAQKMKKSLMGNFIFCAVYFWFSKSNI